MDKIQYTKLSSDTMQVVKQVEVITPEPVTLMYSLDELKSKELSILKSINDFVYSQQTELENVRELIKQANSLGLKTSLEIQAEQVVIEDAKIKEVTPAEPIIN